MVQRPDGLGIDGNLTSFLMFAILLVAKFTCVCVQKDLMQPKRRVLKTRRNLKMVLCFIIEQTSKAHPLLLKFEGYLNLNPRNSPVPSSQVLPQLKY